MATTITLARTYQYFFHTHPNRTLALTGGTLNAFGDIVAQFTQNAVRPNPCPWLFLSLIPLCPQRAQDHQHRPGWDSARTLRFFCFGVGISMYSAFLVRSKP